MTKTSREKALGWWLPLTLLIAGYGACWTSLEKHSRLDDPDYLYHLSIAREYSTHGHLATLPQAEDLGWGRAYPDKEWLFHRVEAVGFSVAGENGARAVAAGLVVATLVVLYVIATSVLGASGWLALLLIGSTLLLTPNFVVRLCAIRPHLSGELCAAFALLCALKRWPRRLAAVMVALALSYSTPFLAVPLIVFAALRAPLLGAWALIGYAAGTLGHPDFPANLIAGASNWRIAASSDQWTKLQSGAELIPPTPLKFFSIYAFSFAVLILAWVQCGSLAWERRADALKRVALLTGLASAFLILAMINHRAIEYALPWTALAGIAAVVSSAAREGMGQSGARTGKGARSLVIALLLGTLMIQVPSVVDIARRLPRNSLGERIPAIAAIPPAEASSGESFKIFNCDWAAAPYLLYLRPDLRWVDALDPFWLAGANPAAFELKQKLREGAVPDPREAMSTVFKADYALCSLSDLTRQMELDPHFERVYPNHAPADRGVDSLELYLYKIARAPLPNFVAEFERKVTAIEGAKYERIAARTNENLPPSRMISTEGDSGVCTRIRVAPEAIDSHLGAEWLAIGGAGEVHVRLGGGKSTPGTWILNVRDSSTA